MTWHFDPSGETFDAYDHTGELVATDIRIKDTWGKLPDGTVNNPPQELLDVMDSVMADNQPSAYNQQVLRDITVRNIQHGTP